MWGEDGVVMRLIRRRKQSPRLKGNRERLGEIGSDERAWSLVSISPPTGSRLLGGERLVEYGRLGPRKVRGREDEGGPDMTTRRADIGQWMGRAAE